MPHRAIPPVQRANAKRLRRMMTGAEKRMWRGLQNGQIGGVSFRKQVPIGPYIVDFASHGARLIIELDGGQHNIGEHVARDRIRDDFLTEAGYRVLRFWNFEIDSKFDAVLERIYLALIEQGLPLEASRIATTPHPVPPPQGGRGRKLQDPALGVSSPLEGEGQGGGLRNTFGPDVGLSPHPTSLS